MTSTSLFRKSNKIKLFYLDDMDEMLYESSKQQQYENTNSSHAIPSYFSSAFYAAVLFGLPYHPASVLNRNSENPFYVKLWCFCCCVAKAFVTLVFLPTCVLYMPYKLTIFSFCSISFVTIGLTLCLFRSRRKVTASTRRLCELLASVSPGQKTGSRFCFLQVMILGLALVYNIWYFTKGVYSLKYPQVYRVLGIDLLDPYRASTIFIYMNGIVTSGVTLVICNGIFVTLTNVIIAFRLRLKGRYGGVGSGGCCKKNILEDIVMFRRIITSYHQLEETLSPLLLFVNAMYVIIFLNSLGILLTRTLPLVTTIGIVITFGQTMVAFLFLIFSAARVIKEYDFLKKSLVRCSEKITSATSSVSEIALFTVLSDNIRSTDFQFSAGDMFVLNKALILTVAGVMVTYGVIEYQLSNTL